MMNTLVAFPSTASFGQHVALAFHERNKLAGYLTTFAYRDRGALARTLHKLPGTLGAKIDGELRRRSISAVPEELVQSRAFWEVVRTIADKSGAGKRIVDQIWDHLSHDFARTTGRRLVRGVEALYAYEYTAFEAFEVADRHGIAKILDFPSLDSRQFEALQQREKANYPELIGPDESYFLEKFEPRQARRDWEAAQADVVITNSSVTRASHIAAGVDPEKTFAVPYGAPPTIDVIRPRAAATGRLQVVWAGTFNLRKGAHYFIEGWRSLAAGDYAQAEVYGAVALPERLWKPTPRGMTFHGSVVRSKLFDAFETADVLVFPTLSDGFGMVVTEAFSRGLPVITTNQAGASDLVVHDHNGLIVPAGDPRALADAIRWCLDNWQRLEGMRHAALETAKNWQWSDYRRALIDAVHIGLTRAGFEPGFASPRT